MKLILRNSTQVFQTLQWSVVEKLTTEYAAATFGPFSDNAIRSTKRVLMRLKILSVGNWVDQTATFRLCKGATDDPTNITSFISDGFSVNMSNGTEIQQEISGLDFSNTTTYPDTNSLRITIVTSDYSTGLKAKTVQYRVEYLLFDE